MPVTATLTDAQSDEEDGHAMHNDYTSITSKKVAHIF